MAGGNAARQLKKKKNNLKTFNILIDYGNL